MFYYVVRDTKVWNNIYIASDLSVFFRTASGECTTQVQLVDGMDVDSKLAAAHFDMIQDIGMRAGSGDNLIVASITG